MLARAARPKLALAVPTITTTFASIAKSPLPRTPISPTPLNRGFSTMQPPTFAYSQPANTKSILKKGPSSGSSSGKKLQFREEATVRCITLVPEDYHGTYLKMSKDERRWGTRNWEG